MVKVKYLPENGTPDQTETLGIQFDANEPTDVTDKAKLAVLRGNPFFEVQDAPKSAPKTPSAATGDGKQKLEAVLQDDGSFLIMQGDKAVEHPPLSKEEADAFNQLTDDDKAEYVK